MTYFNTTHVLGKQLSEYTHAAQRQEETILRFFFSRPDDHFTPTEVWSQCYRQHPGIRATVPITSVRRAITNLTNEGDLVKTNRQADGMYGRPEYKWRLATHHLQGDLFK